MENIRVGAYTCSAAGRLNRSAGRNEDFSSQNKTQEIYDRDPCNFSAADYSDGDILSVYTCPFVNQN